MSEPKIFAEVLDDLRHARDTAEQHWDAFTSHTVHRRYHDHSSTATTPEGHPMSLITTLENDAADLRAHVEEFITSKLPAATADLKKLEGNPVVDALLNAVHVPAPALDVVVGMINSLAGLFPKPVEAAPVDVAQPVEAAPADMAMPEPVPAGPTVAGQA
jgi:hypothetical protein